MKPLILVSAMALSGCSIAFDDHRNYPSTTYKFGEKEVDRPTAEAALIERVLRAQLSITLDAPLTAVSVVLPVYPRELRRQEVTGEVTVRFVIAADGTVEEVQTVRSSGTALDEIAAEAVRKWRFNPPTKDGKPARIRFGYKFVFSLV